MLSKGYGMEFIMKKMLIFHHYNSAVGAGLSLLHILDGIDKKLFEITVCSPHVKGDLSEKIEKKKIRLIYSNAVISYMHFSGNNTRFLSRAHFKNIKAICKAKDEVKAIIESENPDIVAVNSMTLFWIGRIAQECGCKTLCFHRETYRKGLLGMRTSYIKKCLGEYFNVVAFLSYYDMEQTPIGKAKYIRLTDKVDVSLYEALDQEQSRYLEKLPMEDKLLLYAGGMAKLKGPEVLIKAMSKIHDSSIKVVFLQYTPMKVEGFVGQVKNLMKIILHKNFQYKIENYIKKHNLQEKIIFRPATDKVERYFVACDAVVFPCHNPHQARPIYEAGIAKKPIIISDFPNYSEFVDDTNAWLFPADDSQKLADCIENVFSQDIYTKIQNNYRRTFEVNNLKTMPRELEKIFKIMDEMN